MLYMRRILLQNSQCFRLPQYSTNSLLSMKEQKYYSDSKVPFPRKNKKNHKKKQHNLIKKPEHYTEYLSNEKSKLQVNSLIEKLIKKSERGDQHNVNKAGATTFEEEITLRRDQAHRSILFKIKDSRTLPDQLVHVLLSMCVGLINVSLIGKLCKLNHHLESRSLNIDCMNEFSQKEAHRTRLFSSNSNLISVFKRSWKTQTILIVRKHIRHQTGSFTSRATTV